MALRIVDGQKPGIRRIRRGRGFEYRDARGRHLDDARTLERIRALAIPPAWEDVWICPHPDGHLQATGVDAAGRTQYRYHPEWARRAAEAKFDRALDLARALPAARRSVTRDLRAGGMSRATVLAAGFRMLDVALLRVGSEEYAERHGSVGLCTLRARHVAVDGETVRLRFRGKSSVPWQTELEDPDLAAVLDQLRRRGSRTRLLAWREDGPWHPVRPADINEDVRARTGGDFTAKDFRTIHATVIAARSLARSGAAETAAAGRRAVRLAVEETALALGNTPAVARGSYIDPRLFERYAQGLTVNPNGRSVEQQLIELLP
ncbi:Eukaryotic DNA topoisomerase I, catalytic core [Microbacterium azadirachtae]|uniref:DNA topoisomerase n=1 Tax=Microbacterium azadirachtae TaxID=582680 RepID=A0A0F0L021_9MICO|nr:DNA topoisomerase IB [Microbacterium azadirachtae]KJL24901.1 Eukaryotic DNA topoisomerase I, catalytic core [Microbacterium azadirachtae]